MMLRTKKWRTFQPAEVKLASLNRYGDFITAVFSKLHILSYVPGLAVFNSTIVFSEDSLGIENTSTIMGIRENFSKDVIHAHLVLSCLFVYLAFMTVSTFEKMTYFGKK